MPWQANGHQSYSETLQFDTTKNSSITSITEQLAPGVLTSLAGGFLCVESTTYNTSCLVGTGAATGGTPVSFNIYLVPPTSPATQAAGFDFVLGTTTKIGHADLSLIQPNSGPAAGQIVGQLSISGTSAAALENHDTLTVNVNGTLNGVPFTRLPSGCSNATPSNVSVVYGGGTIGSDATPDFNTSATCSTLPFQPRVSSSAAKDTSDNGVDVRTTIAQNASAEAAIKDSTLAVPSATLQANAAALTQVCPTYPVVTGCHAVGEASSGSPLLPAGLTITGSAYLIPLGGGVGLAIVLNNPPSFHVALVGAIQSATNSLAFTNLPDVPLNFLSVHLFGGPTALFKTTCGQPTGTLVDSFTGQNGKHATANSPVTVSGCHVAAGPSASSGKFSGLKKGKPKLSFKLSGGGSKLKSFSVKLPGGLSFNKKKVKKNLKVSGAKVKSATVKGGKLVVTLKSASSSFSVTIKSPGLKEKKGLRKKVKKHKVKSLTVKLTVTSSTATKTNISLKITKIS